MVAGALRAQPHAREVVYLKAIELDLSPVRIDLYFLASSHDASASRG
jgi:hypothetical protein